MNVSPRSISSLTHEELNQYPIELNWEQGRGLGIGYCDLSNEGYPHHCNANSYCEEIEVDARRVESLLEETMDNLTHDDIYIDVGAGDGRALKEYRLLHPNGAAVVGVASTLPYKDVLNSIINQDRSDAKFSYYLGDFKTFPTESLEGRVTVITDIFASLRYGCDPAQIIRQTGKLLKEGGLVFFRFSENEQITLIANHKHSVSSYKRISLFQLWFRTIKGFDVIEEKTQINKSRELSARISNDHSKLRVRWFNPFAVILRRNADPVEVDSLNLNPQGKNINECRKISDWSPNYTWEMSSYSQSFLPKK